LRPVTLDSPAMGSWRDRWGEGTKRKELVQECCGTRRCRCTLVTCRYFIVDSDYHLYYSIDMYRLYIFAQDIHYTHLRFNTPIQQSMLHPKSPGGVYCILPSRIHHLWQCHCLDLRRRAWQQQWLHWVYAWNRGSGVVPCEGFVFNVF
jgi:hypothetical protein